MSNVIEHFNLNDFSNIINEYNLDKRLDSYIMFEELHYTVTHSEHDYEFTDGAVCDWLNTWDVYTKEELFELWKYDIEFLINFEKMPESLAREQAIKENLFHERGFHTDRGVYYIPTSDTTSLIFEPVKEEAA